jgi:hypothetical protein
VLEYFNYGFIAIFTMEVVVEVIGLGFRGFVKDRFKLFDTLVVLMSIVEVAISDGSGATSSLRAFRLFRIFKIFKVGNLRIMLDSLTKTIQSIGNYVILLLLFIYVFALMGMQFFAGKLKFNDEGQPDIDNGKDRRYNFNTIDITFLTIFQLLIGDNWNDLMYDTVRVTSMASVIYFIVITVIVTLVMVNLLIAIIISNFDSSRIYASKQKMIEELKQRRDEGYSPYEAAKLVLGKEVTKYAFMSEKENLGNGISVSLDEAQRKNPHGDISSKAFYSSLDIGSEIQDRIQHSLMSIEEFRQDYEDGEDYEDEDEDEEKKQRLEDFEDTQRKEDEDMDSKYADHPANQQ